MTPHDDFIPLIVRAADGALDNRERVRLDAHLAECAGCREALETQTTMRALLAQRPPQQASPDFSRRVRAALPLTRGSWIDTWDFRVWTWRLAPIAALLLVATFSVVRHAAVTTTRTNVASVSTSTTATTDDSVSSALWSSSVSDTSVLSLMIYAQADDSLASRLKDTSR